jgi:hypothetical protein
VLAERGGAIDGYATVQPDRDTWSPHVAELRVHVAPGGAGRGSAARSPRKPSRSRLGRYREAHRAHDP